MQARTIIKNSVKRVLLSLSGLLPEAVMPILLYHSIDNSEMEDSVSPEVFFHQMEYLHSEGYRAISLDEIDTCLKSCNRRELSKTFAITFDDGYRSVYQHAMPILRRFVFPASVFLPTQHVGRHSEWTQPQEPLLSWKEVLAMQKDGILFGTHSHSHRDLTVLTQEQARNELETSKKILEDKLGVPIAYTAYPFSKSNGVIESLALECGYKTSFSAIGVESRRRRSMQKDSSVVLRRSVIKKDDMLAFEFVLASTYHYYFDLHKVLSFSKEERA